MRRSSLRPRTSRWRDPGVSDFPIPAPTPAAPPPEIPPPRTLLCANCEAALTGEYCSACGQRHEPHIHSVAHFASEAFESLTHADSRLWRTLGYLLAKPGRLTKDFFAGKRAAYLPPFRLYLVISVVFFLVGLPTDVDLRIPASPAESTITIEPKAPGEPSRVNLSLSGLEDFCHAFKDQAQSDNRFRNNLRDRCLRLAAGDGRTIWNNGLTMIPRAMFIFLPLMALIMLLLYWRPRRYYVEHLLFLVHNHAFVFVALTLMILLEGIPILTGRLDVLWLAVYLYMAWYIFRAMRVVYGQTRALTSAKYVFMGISYFFGTLTMLLITFLWSAMTL